MTILELLATISGSIMALSGFPQMWKIFRRKSAGDIAPITYWILIPGGIIWILYGIEIENMPIILSNVIGLFTAIGILFGWFLYGQKKARR